MDFPWITRDYLFMEPGTQAARYVASIASTTATIQWSSLPRNPNRQLRGICGKKHDPQKVRTTTRPYAKDSMWHKHIEELRNIPVERSYVVACRHLLVLRDACLPEGSLHAFSCCWSCASWWFLRDFSVYWILCWLGLPSGRWPCPETLKLSCQWRVRTSCLKCGAPTCSPMLGTWSACGDPRSSLRFPRPRNAGADAPVRECHGRTGFPSRRAPGRCHPRGRSRPRSGRRGGRFTSESLPEAAEAPSWPMPPRYPTRLSRPLSYMLWRQPPEKTMATKVSKEQAEQK